MNDLISKAIRCPSHELSVRLFEYLKTVGVVWVTGEKLFTERTLWDVYRDNTVYFIDSGMRLTYGLPRNIDSWYKVVDVYGVIPLSPEEMYNGLVETK